MFSASSAQEACTVPFGTGQGTEEHFAGGRVGYSIYISQTWSKRDGKVHTLLISRVLEKTSHFAAMCTKFVLDQFDWGGKGEGVTHLRLWSDGPKQFKSSLYMGTPRQSRINYANICF